MTQDSMALGVGVSKARHPAVRVLNHMLGVKREGDELNSLRVEQSVVWEGL